MERIKKQLTVITLFVFVFTATAYSADGHLRIPLLSKEKEALQKLRDLFYNDDMNLRERLHLQGITEKEIDIIGKETKEPQDYRYFYEYELGIVQIKSLMQYLKGPVILVIEGEMGSGKSTLIHRLATGRDFGINPSAITVFDEDILDMEHDEDEMRDIIELFIETIETDKNFIIYDGHFFIQHVRTLPSVYDRTKELLKKFYIIKVSIEAIWDREGRILTKNEDFVTIPTIGDLDFDDKLQSQKRYIMIKPDAILQKAKGDSSKDLSRDAVQLGNKKKIIKELNRLKVKTLHFLRKIGFRFL
ncbi:MAG: hypothetical protein P9L93_04800 [Candidatus Gorgyraea atricola]|nr:hypothetical protein [Candidatus Gorgyraea atricola]